MKLSPFLKRFTAFLYFISKTHIFHLSFGIFFLCFWFFFISSLIYRSEGEKYFLANFKMFICVSSRTKILRNSARCLLLINYPISMLYTHKTIFYFTFEREKTNLCYTRKFILFRKIMVKLVYFSFIYSTRNMRDDR